MNATTTPETITRTREINTRRTGDGRTVRLLWEPETERIFINVEGEQAEVLEGDVTLAFDHPYPYIAWSRGER